MSVPSILLESNSASGGNPPISLPPDLRPHILMADDDQKIRELTSKALARSGFIVDAVEDGAIAWSAIQTDRYDLLVTDNQMPNLTGVDLLQKLHAARMTLPVILITGNLPQEELMRHPWLEIEAVLIKPFAFDDLLNRINNILRIHYGEARLAPFNN